MAWIRSQNGELLIKASSIFCDNLRYDKHNAPVFLLKACGDWDDAGANIGCFPTKEAALAELDCIERWIGTGTVDVYQVTKP